jgi:peptidoglycan hydrolase CwlO-like protein
MKRDNKKIKSTPEYDSQRETRVLLEDIHSEVKTVVEQHGSIVKKLDEHDKRFDRMESELTTVKMAVMDNSRDIKELKTGQQEIGQKLDTVIADHEHRLQKLETV